MAAVQEHEEDDKKQTLLKEDQVGDGSITLSGKPVVRSKTGTWKSAPFVYVLIFADTVSVLGIAGNLVTYARGTLHMGVADSANTVTNFMGVTYLLPLFWGFLADAYFGRFWIITIGSIFTLLGLVLLTTFTLLHSPSCNGGSSAAAGGGSSGGTECPQASSYALAWFYSSLYLVSVGSAALKPCMLSLGQDQFDDTDPKEKQQGASFFSAYYAFLNCYSIFCVTVLFYIQSSVSFSWGYGTNAVIYLVGVLVFYTGMPFFRHRRAAGSTLTRVARVLVAATRNANRRLPANANDLYELDDEQCKSDGIRKVVHTERLTCLDKAAIVPPADPDPELPESGSRRLAAGNSSEWALCTVTQVEELKAVVQILPIWASLVLVFTLYAQVTGIGTQQAATMDRRLGPHFTVPPGSAAICLMLSGISFVVIYENVLVPRLAKLTGHPEGLSPLRKIGVALFLAIVAMVVAAKVENRRVQAFEANENKLREVGSNDPEIAMSVWWLVPQFILLGWVEILLGVAQLHFLYRETPYSMRNLGISATFTTISIGYFVSTGLVSTVNKYTASSGGWLEEDFNTGGLQKYYYLLATIMSVNFLVFLPMAYFYQYKQLHPLNPNELPPNVSSATSGAAGVAASDPASLVVGGRGRPLASVSEGDA